MGYHDNYGYNRGSSFDRPQMNEKEWKEYRREQEEKWERGFIFWDYVKIVMTVGVGAGVAVCVAKDLFG